MDLSNLDARAVMPIVRSAATVLALSVYVVAQLLVLGYSLHRYSVLWRWWRSRRASRVRPPARSPARPLVTVQVPLFDEPAVARRVVDAVAALDYPRDRLEIQILDDSTDVTTAIVERAAARHRRRGVDIAVLHRDRRAGFKAGALADGLRAARGELIAVFDADFVPPRDFLLRLLPHFRDPGIGMVQARWGHLNRERSLLTDAQAVMLDAHFILEHEVRMRRALFFNFNGTAGIWRRACIDDAGGWSADTVTEDLDLSYRAQLKGWRFAYDPDVVCPAELPGDIDALKSQQRRWTMGSIQTAVKLLPRILASRASREAKLEAFVHLTSNLAYPLLLALAVLTLPLMIAVPVPDAAWASIVQAAVVVCGVVPILAFLAVGQMALPGRAPWRVARGTLAAILIGIGLAPNNAGAALRGFGRRSGDWERTPKTGDRMSRSIATRPLRSSTGLVELGLAAYFALSAAVAWQSGHRRALPFIVVLFAGFASVVRAPRWLSFVRLRRRSRLQADDLGRTFPREGVARVHDGLGVA